MNSFLHVGRILSLPELKETLGLQSSFFKVTKIMDGGMGTCACIENAYGGKFALKTIHTDLLPSETSSSRYIQELTTWLTVSACDGVVNALCLVRINDIPCIVSEWMDGGNLRNLMGSISPIHFYSVIDRICTTLQWAYDTHGYIHRDLKPDNILLDAFGKAYVGDWGLAKDLTKVVVQESQHNAISSGQIELTNEGAFIGTILYAAPEQIMGNKNIDIRADIYSIGCVMYEWETGNVPFTGKTIQEVATAVLNTNAKKLGGLFTRTNYGVGKIIDKCLQKNPRDRYQTYNELLADLSKIAPTKASFTKYHVNLRRENVKIGNDEINQFLSKSSNIIRSKYGYTIVEQDDFNKYIGEACNLINLGKPAEGCQILRKFFIKDLFTKAPDDGFVVSITINLAFGLSRQGKNEEALEVLSVLDNASHHDLLYYVNKSCILLSLFRYEESLEAAKQGLMISPEDTDLIGNATQSAAMLGNLEEAKDFANLRLGLDRSASALSEAGLVYYKFAETKKNTEFPTAIKAYKKAYSLYNEALELNPCLIGALLQQSLILFKLKRYKESIEKLTLIKQNVGEIKGLRAAKSIWWMGDCVAAKNTCESWMKQYPTLSFKRLYNQILVDDYILNNYKEGLKIWIPSVYDFFSELINDTDNREPSDIEYLSKLFLWGDDLNNAISLLEWGIQIFPNNWKLYFRLGDTYYRFTKDFNKALDNMRTAIALAPWREASYKVIAEIHKNLGQYDMYDKNLTKYGELVEQKNKYYNETI